MEEPRQVVAALVVWTALRAHLRALLNLPEPKTWQLVVSRLQLPVRPVREPPAVVRPEAVSQVVLLRPVKEPPAVVHPEAMSQVVLLRPVKEPPAPLSLPRGEPRAEALVEALRRAPLLNQ